MRDSCVKKRHRRQLGQTITEYALVAAAFVPLAIYLARKLMLVIRDVFQFIAWDLSGPGA